MRVVHTYLPLSSLVLTVLRTMFLTLSLTPTGTRRFLSQLLTQKAMLCLLYYTADQSAYS